MVDSKKHRGNDFFTAAGDFSISPFFPLPRAGNSSPLSFQEGALSYVVLKRSSLPIEIISTMFQFIVFWKILGRNLTSVSYFFVVLWEYTNLKVMHFQNLLCVNRQSCTRFPQGLIAWPLAIAARLDGIGTFPPPFGILFRAMIMATSTSGIF